MGCYQRILGTRRRAEIVSGARSHMMGSCPHPPPSREFNTPHVIRASINTSPSQRDLYGDVTSYGLLYALLAEGALLPKAMVDEG
jgi:hypothetical protein